MQPEAYWFQSETMSRAMLVEVRVTNGALTVWWPNDDQPVAKLKGRREARFHRHRDQEADRQSQGVNSYEELRGLLREVLRRSA